jgi:hypothetical protein
MLGVAAVPGPQRFDLGDPALVLGDDSCAALVRDVEEVALELAGDPLQVLGPVLHACGVVGSGCRYRSRHPGVRWPFQEGNPGLRLVAGAAQLVELALQRADLRGVEEGGEAERR